MNVSSRELMPMVSDALSRGQRVRLSVTGGSMWPAVRDGDDVQLERAADLRRGDLVLVHAAEAGTPGRFLLHRVIRVERSGQFLVRGDIQRRAEGPFSPESLIGRVTDVWRDGSRRNLHHRLQQSPGLMWFWTSPLGPLLAGFALRSWTIVGHARRHAEASGRLGWGVKPASRGNGGNRHAL